MSIIVFTTNTKILLITKEAASLLKAAEL